MVGIDFSDWLTALGKFQASVASDLDEIRKQKAEIQQLKNDIFSQVAQGRVIRDDQRLVLSAPEIIIGNVDASGTLLSEGGAIVIRGQKVGLEGVGASGAVTWYTAGHPSSSMPSASLSRVTTVRMMVSSSTHLAPQVPQAYVSMPISAWKSTLPSLQSSSLIKLPTN